ncbi:ABC transporter permease [Aestuariibacter halophilus]|uniref:ABC transporter permease n=1 Tax=Fluctibacter halophilus TaxID=226011 RepID=A0ABS8G831_9ALTE|nr:ABC transporter permease [Aestuariibacter halophilus]MCC2616739.1 ABC transporter permease [Aestuariibacter halophilus]
MKTRDIIQFNNQLFARHRWRTTLLMLCVALGVSAVVLLVSVGESARQYVEREFSMLGSNLLIILPGKKQTSGGGVPFYGTTTRDLTLADANSIRQLPGVRSVAPIIAGTANVSVGPRSKNVMVIGSTRDFLTARQLSIAMGQSLPIDAEQVSRNVALIGSELEEELFAPNNPLGEMLTIDDYRYRVVGVLAVRGESLGLDMRDTVILPVKAAESLFNSASLFRILIDLNGLVDQQKVIEDVYALIKQRHQGEEDITIITQQSVMEAFNNIMVTLTAVVGLLGAISLVVAGILIMNLSLISVQQRRTEIGLLKALGASRQLILRLFISESVMLVLIASAFGLGAAQLILSLANQWIPVLSLATPLWAHLSAVGVAVLTALVFSYLPARQAANVSPVEVLRG